MGPISSLSSASLVTAGTDDKATQKIKGAAQQFESLMISELLKTARSESGWMGTGDEDQAGQTGLDLGEQQMANVLSKSGGLGLQNFITQSLVRKP
jgi:Rod binding domain-containing protein